MPSDLVDRIIGTIDQLAFAAIAARYGGYVDEDRREKYLDLSKWIDANLRRVKRIGLDTGHRRRILDLGCGCGYFLYICKLLGHEVVGIDRAERQSLFVDVRELLGVPWVAHSIRPMEPLPDLGSFDVMTAHMVTFNGHRVKPWGPDEWRFLLDSIGAPTVSLEMNAEPDGTLYTPGLRELFEERGANINGHRVLIDESSRGADRRAMPAPVRSRE